MRLYTYIPKDNTAVSDGLLSAVLGIACEEKTAEIPSYRHLVAAYSKKPEKSLKNLAKDLARNKWDPDDVNREDMQRSKAYNATGDTNNLVDRYIIQEIGKADKADTNTVRRERWQNTIRSAWENRNSGKSFVKALPKRLAVFRQYRDVPFSKTAANYRVKTIRSYKI